MAGHQGWNSSVPESTELARIYSQRLDRRSLKRVSHSCWLRRLLLHRRECNFIRPGAAFRLREKNSQRRHAIRIRALLRVRSDVAEKVQIDERSALSIGRSNFLCTYMWESRDRRVCLGMSTGFNDFFRRKTGWEGYKFFYGFKSKRIDW